MSTHEAHEGLATGHLPRHFAAGPLLVHVSGWGPADPEDAYRYQ